MAYPRRLAGSRAGVTVETLGDAYVLVPDEPPIGLLVFFHGAGGDASHSLALVGAEAEQRRLLALLPSSAATTWDLLAGGLGPDAHAVDDAVTALRERHEVASVAFGGFSDGASYALSLGLARGVDAVVAFSPGFVAPPSLAGRPRVWISHGDVDRVLPVERCGRRVARTLSDAGYDTTYVEFEGGHVVPPTFVGDALRWWLP